MRIDKYLSQYAGLSRSEAKEAIRRRRVTCSGVPVTDPGQSAEPSDRVELDGMAVTARSGPLYIVMNKPSGVVTATTDPRERTVLDLIAPEYRRNLSPVGRLDKDTTGLLILTDDGPALHRLISPRHHVDKIYEAQLRDPLKGDEAERFLAGLDIGDDKPALPATLCPVGPCTARVILQEGRYHQVKRMFEAVGNRVTALKRLSMGNFSLPSDLAEGEYRIMTEAEVRELNVSKYQSPVV